MQFTPLGQFELPGRGTVYSVANPVECSDFDHIIGKWVGIASSAKRVVAVERAAHAPPWRAGELIGLLVSDDLEEGAPRFPGAPALYHPTAPLRKPSTSRTVSTE